MIRGFGSEGWRIQRLHQGSETARDGKIHAPPTGARDGFIVFTNRGQLRMIVDARRVNNLFKRAPSASMTSPEVLSSLECAASDTVFSSAVDIKDCFHRLKLSEEFSDLFCLPSGRAGDFGCTHVDGRAVDPDEEVWPACACLPMGFAWSVFYAQDVAVEMVARAGVLTADDELREGHSDVVVNRRRLFCYVDNIGIIGLSTQGVRDAMAKVTMTLEAHGLVTRFRGFLCRTGYFGHRARRGTSSHSHYSKTLQ